MDEQREHDMGEHERRWIAEAAYFRWLARGAPHGDDQEDWLQAQDDLVLHRWFDCVETEHPCFAFLALSELAYAYRVIDEDELLERAAYHHDVFHAGEADDEPPGELGGGGPRDASEEDGERGEETGCGVSQDSGGLGPDWLEFMPVGPIAHLKLWRFHEHDRDPQPSVPHGHYEGKPYPKLDPYLGWVDDGPNKKRSRRLSKKETRALWNDRAFRDFALKALRWFIADRKSQSVGSEWRVTHPLRLPRRR